MKIIFKESFLNRLEKQVDYIACDSPDRARKFKKRQKTKAKAKAKNK